MDFKDHFSGHAQKYAEFRPSYPADLAAYLAGLAPSRHLAWDCGTGNGQAAILLAEHFDHVTATDPSRQQLLSATPHPKITYLAAPAEQAPLADGSVDLVTVAQALHWFDFDRFYAEVHRVSKPGAVFAAWCYELARISPEVDRWVEHYYRRIVGRYWPVERRYIEQGYRTIPFPFAEIQPPAFTMQAEWTLDEFLGYLSTWSAGQRASRELGYDVLHRAANDTSGIVGTLPAAWGAAEATDRLAADFAGWAHKVAGTLRRAVVAPVTTLTSTTSITEHRPQIPRRNLQHGNARQTRSAKAALAVQSAGADDIRDFGEHGLWLVRLEA